jgi:hypothetical protein
MNRQDRRAAASRQRRDKTKHKHVCFGAKCSPESCTAGHYHSGLHIRKWLEGDHELLDAADKVPSLGNNKLEIMFHTPSGGWRASYHGGKSPKTRDELARCLTNMIVDAIQAYDPAVHEDIGDLEADFGKYVIEEICFDPEFWEDNLWHVQLGLIEPDEVQARTPSLADMPIAGSA